MISTKVLKPIFILLQLSSQTLLVAELLIHKVSTIWAV